LSDDPVEGSAHRLRVGPRRTAIGAQRRRSPLRAPGRKIRVDVEVSSTPAAAMEASASARLHAVMVGMHLFPADEDTCGARCEAEDAHPDVVIPMHSRSGFVTANARTEPDRLITSLPDEYLFGA